MKFYSLHKDVQFGVIYYDKVLHTYIQLKKGICLSLTHQLN